MGESEGCFPVPILILYIDSRQGNLNTGIADRTDIGHHGATTGNERKLDFKEQILRCLLVDIDATVDAATNETEVDTGIILSRGLPLQILIHNAGGSIACAVLIAKGIED